MITYSKFFRILKRDYPDFVEIHKVIVNGKKLNSARLDNILTDAIPALAMSKLLLYLTGVEVISFRKRKAYHYISIIEYLRYHPEKIEWLLL